MICISIRQWVEVGNGCGNLSCHSSAVDPPHHLGYDNLDMQFCLFTVYLHQVNSPPSPHLTLSKSQKHISPHSSIIESMVFFHLPNRIEAPPPTHSKRTSIASEVRSNHCDNLFFCTRKSATSSMHLSRSDLLRWANFPRYSPIPTQHNTQGMSPVLNIPLRASGPIL